jgi:NifB/MoaA-like Fe-S oxidoreductase
MKVKEILKDMYSSTNSALGEIDNSIKDIIDKIKKASNDEKFEEKIKLIEQICKGENLNLKDMKNKYLSDKEKKKIIEPTNEVIELKNDDLLDMIKIDNKTFYYENKEKGTIYNSERKSVGIFKDGKFILS